MRSFWLASIWIAAGCSHRAVPSMVVDGDRPAVDISGYPRIDQSRDFLSGRDLCTGAVCYGSCVNLASDNSNCGFCGHACDVAKKHVCQSGRCSCSNGLAECEGVCVDLMSDSSNCGSCGVKCPTCGGGACSTSKTFTNPTVDGRNIEWGVGGQHTPGAPDAFCKLMGLSKAISWQCCGGACGSDVECHFTTCEKWYINGGWTDGNCDGLSYDVFTTIVCAVP